MATPEEPNTGEISITAPGGFTGKAKGYRLGDALCVVTAAMVGYSVIAIAEHRKDAEKGDSALLIEVKKANAETAAAVKESTYVLRQTNQAIRELICVTALPMDKRMTSIEVCKRIAKGEEASERPSH